MIKKEESISRIFIFVATIMWVGTSLLAFMLIKNNQKAKADNIKYEQLSTKQGYVTIDQAKHIYKNAINLGNTKLLNKLDNSTVVNNSNGHEYTVQITGGGLSKYHIHFQPIVNSKVSIINNTWKKAHQD